MRAVRAVLDPNVLVAAVLSRGGTPAALLRAWLDGAFELVVSPLLLDELERVLRYPKIAARVGPPEAGELMAMLRRQAELVADPDPHSVGGPVVSSPDPDDDYLIFLARVGTAVLVSGDSDLTGLAGRIPVYTPAAFRDLLAAG